MIKCPDKCLICGSPWMGGCARPGGALIPGARVYYDCGCSLSAKILQTHTARIDGYTILITNCQNDETGD